MIQPTKGDNSFILFQEWNDKQETPGEQALLIEGFGDCIQLNQNGNTINLNYHHVNDLVKLLKQMKP